LHAQRTSEQSVLHGADSALWIYKRGETRLLKGCFSILPFNNCVIEVGVVVVSHAVVSDPVVRKSRCSFDVEHPSLENAGGQGMVAAWGVMSTFVIGLAGQ